MRGGLHSRRRDANIRHNPIFSYARRQRWRVNKREHRFSRSWRTTSDLVIATIRACWPSRRSPAKTARRVRYLEEREGEGIYWRYREGFNFDFSHSGQTAIALVTRRALRLFLDYRWATSTGRRSRRRHRPLAVRNNSGGNTPLISSCASTVRAAHLLEANSPGRMYRQFVN